jgi:hypothetical protein
VKAYSEEYAYNIIGESRKSWRKSQCKEFAKDRACNFTNWENILLKDSYLQSDFR